jgi:hypothetical protein
MTADLTICIVLVALVWVGFYFWDTSKHDKR